MSQEWVLPADATAPATARTHIAGLVPDWVNLDEILIVVSELATNAIRHGRPPVTVRAATSRGRLRIEVVNARTDETDDAGSDPGARPSIEDAAPFEVPEPSAIGGRGLAIVQRLAHKWGWDETDAHTTVWAEVESET